MNRLMAVVFVGLLGIPVLAFAEGEPGAGPPPNKQWKVVFRDEFNGSALDRSKWTYSPSSMPAFTWNGAKGVASEDHAAVDGQGHFIVKVSRDADGTYRYNHGVETKGKFQRTYGYFETRAKFTRQPGWWGAVWLYGVEVGPNPFLMGQEIDIFEDFYKPKKKLDFSHNVHFDAQLAFAPEDKKHVGKLDGSTLFRVSRGSQVLVNDWDAFHVIGVEWTPLEYVFYCDGRETFRLDYKQAPVTTQPMHVLISACFREPKKGGFFGDYADATWPDQLVVDYVRVYEEDLGTRQKPKVTVRLSDASLQAAGSGSAAKTSSRRVIPAGRDLSFEIAAQSSGTVKSVLLFDNGRIRGEQPAGSATITVPASQLYAGENIVIAMARDQDGVVGMSEPLTFLVRSPAEGARKPYEGKPQAVPGKIVAGRYDEGGQNVAYGSYLKDNLYGRAPWNLKFRPTEGLSSPNVTGIGASHRGLWVTYTVQVQKTGQYRVASSFARPDAMRGYSEKPDRIFLEVDDEPLCDFSFNPELTTGKAYWGNYQPLPAKIVQLSEGTHVLLVRFDATPLNFGGLEFTASTQGP